MTTHDVVIAGGGPTGLMLAAELALAAVDVVVVERRPDQALPGSRAGGLHARTLELLDQRGVVERFVAQGKAMQVASFGAVPLDISDFPTRHPHALALWQQPIEETLAAWVAELGVPILRRRDVVSFAADDDGVDVALVDDKGAGVDGVRGRYLVGCDGGRSVVRKQAGIDFAGFDASVTYLIAEGVMSAPPPPGIRHGAKGVNGVGPVGDGVHMRMVLIEDEVRSGEPSVDDLKAAIVAVYGSDFGLGAVRWLSRFSDMTRQAAVYRAGRVLVAGDAAHIHSPAGGQGLNLGVHDAVNLGWKLAQVVKGTSPPSLLDSYGAERHPVTARILQSTMAQTALNRGDDRTAAARAQLAAVLRLDGPRRHLGGMLSGLDVHYDFGPGHPLLGRRMPDLDVVTADGPRRVFQFLHRARPLLLRLGAAGAVDDGATSDGVVRVEARCDAGPSWELPVLGAVPAPTAVLVRPDGHVAWVGDGSDDGLDDALARWCGARR